MPRLSDEQLGMLQGIASVAPTAGHVVVNAGDLHSLIAEVRAGRTPMRSATMQIPTRQEIEQATYCLRRDLDYEEEWSSDPPNPIVAKHIRLLADALGLYVEALEIACEWVVMPRGVDELRTKWLQQAAERLQKEQKP